MDVMYSVKIGCAFLLALFLLCCLASWMRMEPDPRVKQLTREEYLEAKKVRDFHIYASIVMIIMLFILPSRAANLTWLLQRVDAAQTSDEVNQQTLDAIRKWANESLQEQ